MALRYKQVLRSIIVVVKKSNSPARVGQRYLSNSHGLADVGERAVAIVLIESVALIRQVGYHNVRPAIVIVVGEVHAHTGISTAVNVYCNFGSEADVFESAVPLVVIEELDHGVVGNKEIDTTVVIIVRDGHAKSFPGFGETQLLCDLGECPIFFIVINKRGNGLEVIRMAIRPVAFFVLAAPDIIEIPIQIA